MPNNDLGRAANQSAGRFLPSLSQPVDIFSRTFRDLFGIGSGDEAANSTTAESPAATKKIQPVVATLYPAQVAPEPPKPVAPSLRFDPRTKALLQSVCAGLTDHSGGSAELCEALLECEKPPMTEADLARYRGVVQRLTLVARMIDTIESDPFVPEGFKKLFDRLRFTLIKAVVADANFLLQPSHPLRSMTADLAMRATTTRHWDISVERELATALDHAVRDFDLSAAFVRPIVKRLQPLTLEVIRGFMEQIQRERSEREAAVRAREHVDKEIAARLQGAVLHPRLRYVIEVEWKAVLLWQLTTFGQGSAEWQAGIAVAEELLRQAAGIQAGGEVPSSLMKRILTGLTDAGRPHELVVAAFEALAKCTPAPETVATEFARVAMRLSPLSRLMDSAGWFRVFDHGQQKMRWLQARSYDPTNNTVTFGDMDGSNALVMHAQQFLDDLKRGLTAPNQPDEQTNEILTELRAAA